MKHQIKVKSRVFAAILVLALTLSIFLPLVIGQLTDTSIATLSGDSWSLKIDGSLATDLTSKNAPYISAQKSTEKELFVNLASVDDAKNGVVQFKVSTVGLTVYKQLPLDKELNVSEYDFVNSTVAMRKEQVFVSRPENVVNSFACFDDSGRKVLHIYASKLIDAKGNNVYVDSDLKDGLLTVYLDSEFLATATYPVVVDPAFGYTDVGASDDSGYGYIRLFFYTVGENGTVTDIRAYFRGTSGFARAAVYYGDADPLDLLVESASESITPNEWHTFDVADTAFSSATLLWVGDQFQNGLAVAYDTTAQPVGEYDTQSYGAFSSTFTMDDDLQAVHSIYAEYTTSGATPTPTPTSTNTPEPTNTTTQGILALIVILCIIFANIILLAIPAALMRFVFGILSLAICGLALGYSFPFSPYLQLMGLLVSGLAMLAASRVRGD